MSQFHANMSDFRPDQDIRSRFRTRIDLLRTRSELLRRQDRNLIHLWLDSGCSIAQLAQATGVSEPSLRRQMKALLSRLDVCPFLVCLRHPEQFQPLEHRIARGYFVDGLSQKTLARRCKTTEYRVRKVLRRVRALLEQQQRQARSQSA